MWEPFIRITANGIAWWHSKTKRNNCQWARFIWTSYERIKRASKWQVIFVGCSGKYVINTKSVKPSRSKIWKLYLSNPDINFNVSTLILILSLTHATFFVLSGLFFVLSGLSFTHQKISQIKHSILGNVILPPQVSF